MKFLETPLEGVYIVEYLPLADERGFFARTFCEKEFANRGIDFRIRQTNVSMNHKIGTLRGLHYQAQPFSEAKIVSCIQGEIFDVAVDLRPDSKTFKQWFGIKLNSQVPRALYIPKEFAHGFVTLSEKSIVQYLMSEFYQPLSSKTIRWDDPEINIQWPDLQSEYLISDKDRSANLLKDSAL